MGRILNVEELENSKIITYHGSNVRFNTPSIEMSNPRGDFGQGFYMTQTLDTAMKWAADKETSFVYTFEVDLKGLRVYQFDLDKEWLDYVVGNRKYEHDNSMYRDYDVLIGRISDDRIKETINDYNKGFWAPYEAVEILAVGNLSDQIVIKNEKALTNNNIQILDIKELKGLEKQHWKNISRHDKEESMRIMERVTNILLQERREDRER